MTAQIIRTVPDLRAIVHGWRANSDRVAIVPTMGALHAGHLSLVGAARRNADRVIVTIFVNPKQFNNPDDLTAYPRTEHSDAVKLSPYDVDLIYVPDPGEIYPEGFSTNISVAGVSEGLCGAHRPGHFDGVATVVAKLLLQTGAHSAYFGEKDYQQLQVVTRLARDLDIPVKIVGCPTVRDENGLALSSRNARLSPEDRTRAAALFRVLNQMGASLAQGGTIQAAIKPAIADILDAGFHEVEYLELRDTENFLPVSNASRPARLLVAARIGGVRLIDNIAVP